MARDPNSRRPERSAKKPARPAGSDEEVVRLEDLVPRKDVRGGARKRLFGESSTNPSDHRRGGR